MIKQICICLICSLVMVQAAVASESSPTNVDIELIDGEFVLYKDDQPYVVRGAGLNTTDENKIRALQQAGGNTFRTWSTDSAETHLALAQKHDLMVLMGIDLQKELHHFDYNNEAAVAEQFEWVKAQVLAYKDHPNLLGWIVANEPNLLFNDDGSLADVNPKVYDAINDIIQFIHEVDPYHPVTYSFAGVNKHHIQTALERTPSVDFLSVQVYGDLNTVNTAITDLDLSIPFMVTEFGPTGHWETPSTSWGREIEEPSGLKADRLANRLKSVFAENHTKQNIGHFVFYWGQKQERTPTWYGIFNKDGSADARIDEMTRFWSGEYPQNRAPWVHEIAIEGSLPTESLGLLAGSKAQVEVAFEEPDNDQTRVVWVVTKEVEARSQGGAFEQEPAEVRVEFSDTRIVAESAILKATMDFSVPSNPGEYRLFAYIYDNEGKVGTANFPFVVVAK